MTVTGLELHVEDRRFLRACGAGLSESTALVEVSVRGELTRDSSVDGRFRSAASALYRADPMLCVDVADWPGVFLVPGDAPDGHDVDDLRWLGQWIVALTVAMQRWGRDPVFRGRVCGAEQGRLRLAIPWCRDGFFDLALSAALRLIARWSGSGQGAERQAAWLGWLKPDGSVEGSQGSGEPVVQQASADLSLHAVLDGRLAEIQSGGLGLVPLSFVEAAVRRGMPFDVRTSWLQIGWGAHAERFDWAATGRTSWMAMALAKDKSKSAPTLSAAGVPVPYGRLEADLESALGAAQEMGWPLVIKPPSRDGGEGVVVGITDTDRLAAAFEQAQRISGGPVIVERHVPGEDHRLLVVHGRVLQVVRRRPAHVVGDGTLRVRQLVDRLNSDPRRGTANDSLLKVVRLDAEVIDLLAEQGLGPDAVPAAGQTVRLGRIANVSAGGTAEDVTGIAHPDNVALAVRAARIIGLDIAGVDFLSPDISRSWLEVGGAICEVNSQPGFRPHWLADPGRDIAGEILDVVLDGRPARIPTAAITGTNGKTTTTEMLSRIWTAAGKVTGVCTTARVRVGHEIISTDNLSGQPGARILLTDPAVEAAVMELPRKGLIYLGHPCDRYDVAALLNVQDDHLGFDGIDTLEQMAELKAEVLARATQAIVVNAEDELCLAMRARAGTDRHILVARDPQAAAVVEHREQGGEAVFLDQREGRPWIILATGRAATDLMPVDDIPATMNGLLAFNQTNAMFAAALAWAQGIELDTIRAALGSFRNTGEENPGRFNFIEGLPFDLMLDYAHNPDGVRGVCEVAANLPVTGRRLLCTLSIGNRRSHFDSVVSQLVKSFDEFVFGPDAVRIRKFAEYPAEDDPVAATVAHTRAGLEKHGVPPERISHQLDQSDAIRAAFDLARPGDLLVLLAEPAKAWPVIEERLATDEKPGEIRNG